MLQIRAERENIATFLAAGQLVDDCKDQSTSSSAKALITNVKRKAPIVPLGARMLLPPADACPIAQLARERREELHRREQTLQELEEALASAPRLVQ